MRKIYDPMEFQPGMQQIDSDIFDRVIAARKAYQPEQYTACLLYTSPSPRDS